MSSVQIAFSETVNALAVGVAVCDGGAGANDGDTVSGTPGAPQPHTLNAGSSRQAKAAALLVFGSYDPDQGLYLLQGLPKPVSSGQNSFIVPWSMHEHIWQHRQKTSRPRCHLEGIP
jgi:hypothetical protein